MPSPTARTLKLLRTSGYLAAVVETWIPKVNRRRDLFGIVDVLAVHPHREPKVLLLQCTSIGNLSSRVQKVASSPALGLLLAAGLVVECWGWSANGQVKRVRLRAKDLQPEVVRAPRRRRRQTHEQGNLFGADGSS